MSSEFKPELYTVKAVLLEDDKTIVEGYFDYWKSEKRGGDCIVWTSEYDTECDDYFPMYNLVNAYTVCRNTGIKIGDKYLYEYDLCYRKTGLTKKEMVFVEWNEFRKQYSFRSSTNYTGRIDISGDIEIIGNIALSNDDFDKMQRYSDDKDTAYKGPEPTVECRSKQYLNKRAKEFLPR